MAEEWGPPSIQDEVFHVNGVREEGERRRSHEFGNNDEVEVTQEGKPTRICFRKSLDVFPLTERVMDTPDLLDMGKEQLHDRRGVFVTDCNIQGRPFGAFEESTR